MQVFFIKKIESALRNEYRSQRLRYQISAFDRFRSKYSILTFSERKRLANRWLEKYPEQAHFNFITISDWLENIVEKPLRILEIGGWRGDLALKALSSFKEIELWHNYDLLEDSAYQKCKDTRYKLITLDDYIWNKSMVYNYNALIATHMIEHISWNELSSLIMWIPAGISSVLFEAPLSEDAEDYSWKGNHSSHILEKGWAQVSGEMLKAGFQVLNKEENTMMFSR